MKTIKFLLIQFIFFNVTFSQNIESLIYQTKIDSLIQSVRILSGEDSTYINGIKTHIINRESSSGLAASFIEEKLSRYNLPVIKQNFNSDGINIIATQTGSLYPDSIYIICAHYDAVTRYCADDNASGVAAVLEAARILSKHCFKYTIKYALWDDEELGLLGSKFYADNAKSNNELIVGVLNLEMLGYDSDNDHKFDIHTNNSPNSLILKDSITNTINRYNLSLNPHVYNPGTTSSDHSSFWNQDYGAIVFSEAFFGGDGNPAYHSSNDRINLFNLNYYHELSRLAIGTLSSLAQPCIQAPVLRGTYNRAICQEENILINGTIYNSENKIGVEVFTNVNENNYDSIVSVNLSIHPELKSSIFDTICFGDDLLVNGTIYDINNPSGMEVFSNIGTFGCDSSVIINLSFSPPLSKNITYNQSILTSIQYGAKYKWLDCDNNTTIVNETDRTYEVLTNGTYAVEITLNNCTDTSECILITKDETANIIQNTLLNNIEIYPNPNSGIVNINLNELKDITINVTNTRGEYIYIKDNINDSFFQFELKVNPGVYFIEVISKNETSTFKILIE